MDIQEAWHRIDILKTHPELAGTPGYEVEELRETVSPEDWFFLLAEQPRFSPPEAWWFALRTRCGLPWAMLLGRQPRFEAKCHWESVSRLELVLLAYEAPEIFQRRFPLGRVHDLEAFLTPLEMSRLLARRPEHARYVDWETLSPAMSVGEWFGLLCDQPQFAEYFDWARVSGKPSPYWDMLLKHQPRFAGHCDMAQLGEDQRRRLKRSRPRLFGAEDVPDEAEE